MQVSQQQDLISNLDESGLPVKDNGTLGSYEVIWHSDNSYVAVPPAGSMLLAVVLPTNYIIGMPNVESERLLDRLWAHATQDKYAWRHRWRLGDLVLWDNRCCMHYRSEVDSTQARVLYRTVVEGEAVIPG